MDSNQRGVVVLRYTDTGCDCSTSPANDCDFDEHTDILLTDGTGSAAWLSHEYPGECSDDDTPTGGCKNDSYCNSGEWCSVWDDIATIQHDGSGRLLQVVWSNQATDEWVYTENDLGYNSNDPTDWETPSQCPSPTSSPTRSETTWNT